MGQVRPRHPPPPKSAPSNRNYECAQRGCFGALEMGGLMDEKVGCDFSDFEADVDRRYRLRKWTLDNERKRLVGLDLAYDNQKVANPWVRAFALSEGCADPARTLRGPP